MAVALYDPTVGYYRRDRARVGYEPGTIFSPPPPAAPIFGELLCGRPA